MNEESRLLFEVELKKILMNSSWIGCGSKNGFFIKLKSLDSFIDIMNQFKVPNKSLGFLIDGIYILYDLDCLGIWFYRQNLTKSFVKNYKLNIDLDVLEDDPKWVQFCKNNFFSEFVSG